MAIIGLLIAILLPSLSSARVLTLRTLCAGNLRQVDIAMRMYLNAHNDTYPCANDPLSISPFYYLWMGRGWRNLIMPHLGTAVNTTNPSVLYCPADPASKDTFEATSYAYSMAFYHSPEQIDAATSKADTYNGSITPSVAQRTSDVATPAGKILIGDWDYYHPGPVTNNGWWTLEGSRNFLMADGQIRFLEATKILPARDGFPDANLTIHGVKGHDVQP